MRKSTGKTLLAGVAAFWLLAAVYGAAFAQETPQPQGGTSSTPQTQTQPDPAAAASALMPQQTSGIFLPGGFAFPQTNPFIKDQDPEKEKKKKYRYKGDSSTAAPMPPRLFHNIPKRRLND